MGKTYRGIALAGMLLVALAEPSEAKLRVVATLTEIGSLIEEIGGERVSVTSIARGDEDPHYVAAKPSHSRRMMKADLLVYNGLQLEVGWLPLLIQGARNRRIQWGAQGHLDLSEGIEPLEVPTGSVDRSMGDVHPEGNPHYTVDPSVYPDLARVIAHRLSLLDPGGASYYRGRLADFVKRWSKREAAWRERLSFLRGVRVITYHQQWEYTARTFGFQIVDRLEDRPGIPPAPRHVAELEKRIRNEEIRWMIYSDLIDPTNPEKLAKRGGCRTLALPQAVGSRGATEDLFLWFETLVTLFEEAHRET